MSEKRNTTDPGSVADPLVTQTYRDIASERAPEHLDRAVLKEAASAARPRYARLRSWTRPMAWAATVMLSVAIVLEVTRLPESQSPDIDDHTVKFEADSVPVGSGRADVAPESAPAVRSLEEVPAAPPERESSSTSYAPAQAPEFKATAKQAAPADSVEKRQRSNSRQESMEEQELAVPEASVDDFKTKNVLMLRQADDMARLQSGQNREATLTDEARTDAPAPGSIAGSAQAEGCDETATATPETWLECIEELEATGMDDAALQQRELLHEAFPDFEHR